MSRAAEGHPTPQLTESPNSELCPPPLLLPLLLPSSLPAAYTAVARAHSRCCVAEKPM